MKYTDLSPSLGTLIGNQLATAKQNLTGPSGSIAVQNADGTSTILGVAAGTAGVAQWVGDTTPPGVPTGITATSRNGVVIVSWDGTLDGGVPVDFAFVTLYVNGVSVGTLTGAGSIPVDGLTIGTTVQVTATASDDAHAEDGSSARNTSAACSPIFVTVAAAVDPAAVAAAQAKADSAAATAQSAIDAGVAAQAKATAATTAATTAQSAADAAAQAAASAVSTANTATTTATSAQTAATNAASTAATAKTAADNAAAAAANAVSTASTASTTASSAQSTANGAASTASTAASTAASAQTTATNAATAASAAQTTASNAASTAAAKAKVTVATTAPSSPSTNDVWIDNSQGDSNAVLKTWSGSGWVTHTDAVATNAATAAAAAQTTATNAATAAASAQATANAAAVSATAASASANGVVTWSTAVASDTPKATSAVWMQYTSSGTIIGQWRWNPATSQWVAQTIDNAVIANLDAGKIVTGLLAAERIAANSIGASKLSITNSTNVFADPEMRDPAAWTFSSGNYVAGNNGANYVRLTKLTSAEVQLSPQKRVSVVGGSTLAFSINMWLDSSATTPTSGNCGIWGTYYDSSGNSVGTPNFWAIASSSLTTTETTYTATASVPATATSMSFYFYVNSVTTNGTAVFIRNPSLIRKVGTVLIEDSSVTTPKLVAGAVTTPVLAANAVTADKADIGSLAAAIITSAYFRTSSTVGQASNGQGLIIDSAGLRTYNSSGTNTVNLSASDGSLTAIGAFKTAASGNRVEVVSETNGTNKTGALYVYNGAAGGETPSWLKTTTSESNVTDTTKSGYRYTTAQLNGGITTDAQSPSVNSAGLTLVRGWYRNASNDVRLTSQAVIGADMTYVNGTVTWIAGFPHITAATLSALNSSPWVARLQSSEFAWAGIIYGHVTADTTAANNGDYIRSGSAWVRPALNLFTPATNPWKGVAFDPNAHRKVIYTGVKGGTTDGNSYLTVDLTSVGFLGLASAQVTNASSTLNRASIVDSFTSLTSLSVIHRNADFSGAANTGVEYAYMVYGWTAL